MLFCKPPSKSGTLIEDAFEPAQRIRFRSINLKKDLSILHKWVHAPHANFWQLSCTTEELKKTYQSVLRNPDAHSFIGLLDEQLVCLVDCYRVQTDELGNYISASYHDAGLHLLMAPADQPVPGLSRALLKTFMRYFFSFRDAHYLYAEPDIYNHKACELLGKCGFSFIENIMLPSKAASLYLMTRKKFYATYPVA